MDTRWFRAALGAALLIAGAGAHAADLSITVDARDIAKKRVHTLEQLAVEPGPLTLVYPKWLPGEHAPSGPLETIIGLKITANGSELAWSRDPYDMYAINVTVPPGATRIDIALETGLATAGGRFSAAPTSSETLAILPWNEFLFLPKGTDTDTVTAEARVVPPPGWKVTSALDSKAAAGGAYAFEPASLTRLIDSPVQMGRYGKQVALDGAAPRSDLEHVISIYADSEEALALPDNFVSGYSKLVAEAGALFGTRMYRHYTWLLSLSDHVAHFGLEHHESSDNRRDLESLTTPDYLPSVAGLLGHEYVHSWNGKYRRPAGLLSPDYQKPMDGSLLWVYEGMTTFWGNILPVRAGLMAQDYYRDLVAFTAGDYDVQTGARWRPLGDTAVAAQELYGAPSAWKSSRRGTDFYAASVFLWLDVDRELRARTGGKANLDDFVGRFFGGPAGAPQVKPYVEDDVFAGLDAVAPNDWRSFIHRHLDQKNTKPLLGALERAGWRLAYSKDKNIVVSTNEKRSKQIWRQWSIGLIVGKSDGTIIDTIDDRAAAKAGAGPGMKVIAVNGRKFSAEVLDAAIDAAQKTRKPIELLVETADFYRTLSVAYYDGPRYPHLLRIDGTPDTLSQVLASRTPAR